MDYSCFFVQWMSEHGLSEVVKAPIDYTTSGVSSEADDHRTEVALGYRAMRYNGESKLIIAVFVRGTNGTLAEWSSNMDIGNTDEFADYPEWNVRSNHMGFDIATNRVLCKVEQYLTELRAAHPELADYTTTYWVTGHSRGGAIANIVAAKLAYEGKPVYAYTFAAPNTTVATSANDAKYNGIFNIVNSDDFITYFPLSQWGFRRYGKTVSVSVAETCEAEWNSTVSVTEDGNTSFWPWAEKEYNWDEHGLTDAFDVVYLLVKNRNDCYSFNVLDTCICAPGIYAELQLMCPEALKQYISYNALTGAMRQQPILLMKMLAMNRGENANGDIELNEVKFAALPLTPLLSTARNQLIASNFGGILAPHFAETYYILSRNVKKTDFT